MWWYIASVVSLLVFAGVAAIRDYRVKQLMDQTDTYVTEVGKKLALYLEYTKHKDESCEYIQDIVAALIKAHNELPKFIDRLPKRHYRSGCLRIQKRANRLRHEIVKVLKLD